jgi:aminopeptidase YwaD
MCATAGSAAAQPSTRPGILPSDILARIQILTADSLEGRMSGSKGAERAAHFIAGEFKRYRVKQFDSVKNYLQPFTFAERIDTIHFEHHTTANIIGFVPGNDPALKDEFIVVGAHYDHLGFGGRNALDSNHEIHYGADDNASGVAGMLELAQYYGFYFKLLKRSVIFVAFSGEEEGLFGSKYFIDHPPVPLSKIRAMINMDMVGRLSADSLLIIEGVGSSPKLQHIYESMNKPKQFNLRLKQAGLGPSDHMNFYLLKIPVAFFFTGFHPDYHKSSDTWDKINAEGEARVVLFASQLLDTLANGNYPLPYSLAAEDTTQHASSFHVYVGGVPDYGYEGDGVKISMVTDHSPAEKSGFKANDILINFGGYPIKTIYDYTDALAKYKPGEIVEATLKRGSNIVKVNVTLGSRAAH